MKWSILGLFVLGVLAAVASVVLMLSFRTRGAVQPELEAKTAEQQEARKVQVLVAAVDLGLRDVIDADDVTEQTVEEGAAPSGSFSDPVQVVGKVLILPMAKGQPFRAECFATDESGLLLASALAPGSRAVSVTLSDDMGIEDLLFPGCMVDVIATVEMESPVSGKVPVSFTLLEKVMVLGVGTSTIVLGSTESSDGGRDRPPVTLLLDADQAELVKLAMEKGSISISMRNPMDESVSSGGGKSLARLSPILAEADGRAREAARVKGLEDREKRLYEMERERLAIQEARDTAELARMKFEQEKLLLEAKRKEVVEVWKVTVLRGGNAQVQSFEAPASNDER